MEKIIVRSWDDITVDGKLIICKNTEFKKRVTIYLKDFSFQTSEIEVAIKVLNSSGGNFEYKPVEVIDTYEKLFEFMGENDFTYRKWNNRIYKYIGLDKTKVFFIEEIEEKYSVDLKILKD